MSEFLRLLSSAHHQQAKLLIIILVCGSVFIPIFFIHSPIIEENNLAKEDSKLASDLEQLAKLSTNQSEVVDIFASLEKNKEWKMARQAILAQDPTIKIQAYHQLIHTISLQTTVGKLYNLAGLPEIRKLWSDICFSLDLSFSNPVQGSSSTYQSPQQSISALPLYEAGLNGSNTVVALLDTGIDITHPDLDDMDDNETTDDPKILGQVSFAEGDPFPFDLNGHGTYCAGLIAGTGNASIQQRERFSLQNLQTSHPGQYTDCLAHGLFIRYTTHLAQSEKSHRRILGLMLTQKAQFHILIDCLTILVVIEAGPSKTQLDIPDSKIPAHQIERNLILFRFLLDYG